MSDLEIPSKEEIIKNMSKHLQTHPEDGEEVLLRTYELAFITGKIQGVKNVKLRVTLHDCITGDKISLDGKKHKIFLYKPDGTRIEKPATKEIEDDVHFLTWHEPDYTFDQLGPWSYSGFADIESPVKSILWVV